MARRGECSHREARHLPLIGPIRRTPLRLHPVHDHAFFGGIRRLIAEATGQHDRPMSQLEQGLGDEQRRVPGAFAERRVLIVDEEEIHRVLPPNFHEFPLRMTM
jgi:hypothetical protein